MRRKPIRGAAGRGHSKQNENETGRSLGGLGGQKRRKPVAQRGRLGPEEGWEPWTPPQCVRQLAEMLIQRFNKSMPLEKHNASAHWVDVRGLRKCILKYFTLRGNNVLIYNSSPYTLGLSICVSDLTS